MGAVVAVAAGLLAACGSEEAPGSATPKLVSRTSAAEVLACTLLTNEEVQEVLGGTMSEPFGERFSYVKGEGDVSSCTYFSTSPEASKRAIVFVEKTTEEETQAAYEKNKAGCTKEVPGLAAAACYHPASPFPQVHMIKGDTYVKIWTRLFDGDDAFEEAKALAEKAAPRMP